MNSQPHIYQQVIRATALRFTRRRRLRWGVRATALALFVAAVLAWMSGLNAVAAIGLLTVAASIGALAGVLLGRPFPMNFAADWLDKTLALPQTLGTAWRFRDQLDHAHLAPVADAAVREVRPTRLVSLAPGRHELVGLAVVGMIVTSVIGAETLREGEFALPAGAAGSDSQFASAGEVLGQVDVTPPAASGAAAAPSSFSRASSSRSESASAAGAAASLQSTFAIDSQTTGYGQAATAEPNSPADAVSISKLQSGQDQPAGSNDGAGRSIDGDTPAPNGRAFVSPIDPPAATPDRRRSTAGLDAAQAMPPRYRDLVTAFFDRS